MDEKKPLLIIMDVESSNHLKNDCDGDVTKLKIGLVGIKDVPEKHYYFFNEDEINELSEILNHSEIIVGYNLVGHNGLDYKILENYGINTSILNEKTLDLMTTMIRAFGSYKSMSLANFAEHTFNIKKKKSKKANYKLIQNSQFDQVRENLIHELDIIEMLLVRIIDGGIVRFKTYAGLIDEHELPPMGGFYPVYEEDLVDPYELPIAGIQMQIKRRYNFDMECSNCKKNWNIKSVSYFGDSSTDKVLCPNCRKYLTDVGSNLMGSMPEVTEIKSNENTNR